mmetsp:Transcript_81450/g.225583  ORF Transcript_81450/g.225583 Transcript_81450/m.225583 type:complete len:274 (+) Transcript_81450:33-854(+)
MYSAAKQCVSCFCTRGCRKPPTKSTLAQFTFGTGSASEANSGSAPTTMKPSNSDLMSLPVPSDVWSSGIASPMNSVGDHEEFDVPFSGSSSISSWSSSIDSEECDLHLPTSPSDECKGDSRDSQQMHADETALDPSIPSIGSIEHRGGKCKPCVWNWRPGGCANGKDCAFCHLCEPRARRHGNAASAKAGDGRRSAGPASGALDVGASCSETTLSDTSSTLSGINASPSRSSCDSGPRRGGRPQRRPGGAPPAPPSPAPAAELAEKAKLRVSL